LYRVAATLNFKKTASSTRQAVAMNIF